MTVLVNSTVECLPPMSGVFTLVFNVLTIAFSSLVLFELMNVFNYRLGNSLISIRRIFKNNYLTIAVIASFLLQIIVIYGLNSTFKTIPLNLLDWAILWLSSLSILLIYEIIKRTKNSIKIIEKNI